jgi:RNA polymerase sigma-70 factor (ECF subfamily)
MTSDVTNIWTEFQGELKHFILNKTKNKDDTDDILQEVFIKIINNHDKLDRAQNLRNYLYGIVKNTVNDYFRNKKHNVSDTEIPGELTEEETLYLNETIADCCIKPFINHLPHKYKEALMLTELQEVSQKELSEKLNISYSGAKSRVQRGKEKLKELILDCCSVESDKYGNLLDVEKKNCNCA